MRTSLRNYVTTSLEACGEGWNRFWFAPSDPIVLGAVRIATGLMALYWQLSYTPDLVEFFGRQGILPLEMLEVWRGGALNFSYFDEALGATPLYALHFAGTFVLLLFTLGVFTRFTSIAALLVTLSYIHRGPMLTALMEPILALIQFYLCLGPSGAALSVDAWRQHRSLQARGLAAAPGVSSWATIAIRLLQVHITAVYVMMALAKIGSPAWWNGSAIWWLVVRPESSGFWLVPKLAPHLNLIEAWTHAIVLFELGFPLLVWNRYTRPLALAVSVPLWLLLALATGFYTFALTMLIANLAFVSPKVLRELLGSKLAAGTAAAPQAGKRGASPAAAQSATFAPLRRTRRAT